LEIEGNDIVFETFAGRSADRDRFSAGIELRGVEGQLSVDKLTLSRNTVRNSIGPGILSTIVLGSAEASEISANTLTDSGRGPSLVGEGNPLRTGVVIAGNTRNLRVSGNTIVNSSPSVAGSTLNGIVLAANCAQACTVVGNLAQTLPTPLQVIGSGWTQAGP
jgi:hypothetical protein